MSLLSEYNKIPSISKEIKEYVIILFQETIASMERLETALIKENSTKPEHIKQLKDLQSEIVLYKEELKKLEENEKPKRTD